MFLLGMSLNTVYGSNMLHELRIFGVLQRLAVSYFIAAGFYALTAPKYYTPPRGSCGQAMKDVLSCVWCWALAAALVTVHTVLTFAVHDPDCPAGYLGPGGKHDDWVAPNCSGGAAGYIDRLLLGQSHIFQNSDARRVYGGLPTDPEGLLGCLTSAVQALLGVQAGATVLLQRSHKSRVSRWLAWALVFALVGALLAGFSREHGSVPINKNLWSISFVLVTSACCLVLLAFCYIFTDAWRIWGGGPFRSPGLNAIALYIAAMIGREDREDALLKSALQADERVRVVSEHLTECLMLLEEAPNPEDKELVEGDVSQCLELAQDIAQAAADISRRRDGKEKPFRGKVGQGLQVPLPPVTVPVFAGDYADWPAFEDLYSSVVHTRTDITPAYKMAQLMSRLHGEPHELLTHLAVSDSNYEVAWKILTDRYRNKRLIVDRLLDQWLSIPTITRGTDLREKIFHPVSVAVSALERQGLPVAGYGYILVHTVLRRLPSEMVARFEQLHGASPRTTSRPTRI
ncbi:hypothetical protein NE865_05900 [Phthorimaea operculella]|nr:hypothetical protein NE865_05900 [Phthorimaea operculella]